MKISKGSFVAVMSALLIVSVIAAWRVSLVQGASFPNWLNYQGRLTTPAGAAVQDGLHNAVFRMFESATGGTEVWTRARPVTSKAGIFSTRLESFPPAFFTRRLWLEVEIDGRVPMPRQELGAVAYAFTAQTALNIAPGALGVGTVTEQNLAAGLAIPIGGVVPWWGDSANVPAGWKLCDGSVIADSQSPLNGLNSPNLTSRFIRGVTGNVRPNAPTGGADTIDLAHSHTVNSHTHDLGNHTHSGTTGVGNPRTNYYRFDPDQYNEISDDHTHPFTTGGPSTNTSGAASPGTNSQLSTAQSIVPSYLGLVYIMRVR